MDSIDMKLMVTDYWHKRHRKRVDYDEVVPILELNEVGGFEVLERYFCE